MFGDSFKPSTSTKIVDGKAVQKLNIGPVTNEERLKKKNDLKERSLLLMTLPKDQIITFSKYTTAKTLFEEICSVFGGNDATKRTQKTLLKKNYENFSSTNNESIDSILTRLQKIIAQLTVFWH